jgi:hypothetical protein
MAKVFIVGLIITLPLVVVVLCAVLWAALSIGSILWIGFSLAMLGLVGVIIEFLVLFILPAKRGG